MMTIMKRCTGVLVVVAISCGLAGSAIAAAPQPTVTGVTPTTAVAGQMITVSGTGLNGTQSVAIGPAQTSSIAVDSAGNWVKFDVPSSVQVGQGTITLTGDYGTYSASSINIQAGSMSPQPLTQPAVSPSVSQSTVVHAPVITLFLPASGKVGSKVTIFGSNFVHVGWVKLGGMTAKFSVLSSTRLRITVPRLAHTGKLTVHASAGTTVSGKSFKVVTTSGT